MCPLYVFIVLCKNAKDIGVVRGIHKQYFAAACIYTAILTEYLNVWRDLRDGFIQIPIISSKTSHHSVTGSSRKNFIVINFFKYCSHFFWSCLSPSILCSVVLSSGSS